MKTLSLVALFLSSLSFALIEVGDTVPNLCWKDAENISFCLDDNKGKVRFLNHATGWCPDCKKEIVELVQHVGTYEKKPVVFFSLMAAGKAAGQGPTPEFLTEWKETYKIPFPVLASPKDAGRAFFDPPYAIPNYVIVNKDGKLAYKSMSATLVEALIELDKLL